MRRAHGSAIDRRRARTPHAALWHVRPAYSWRALERPRDAIGWLTDRGSLTRRLIKVFGDCRVRRLSQGLGRLHRDEPVDFMSGLRLSGSGTRAVVREVVLYGAGTPRVFAHTVVAPRARRRDWPFLDALGHRSLGARLFADPRVGRAGMRFARLDRAHPLARRVNEVLGHALAAQCALLARVSCFTRGRGRLLVTEVFLPTIDRPSNVGAIAL